jgi:hypothetical protein
MGFERLNATAETLAVYGHLQNINHDLVHPKPLSKPSPSSLYRSRKTAAVLAATVSLSALGFAAIGIYGVLSYSVQLRRFELGIRMAIGAGSNTVFCK